MADASNGPDPKQDADHAAAEWLFQDDPASAARAQQPVVAPGGESFDLAEPAPTSEWELAAESAYAAKAAERDSQREAVKPKAPKRAAAPTAPIGDDEVRPARRMSTGPAVDQPWTRGAEWGPTIAMMAAWAAFAWFVIYVLIASEMYGVALGAFAVGTVVGLALFYPIVITLERPVRMTPEQAVRDYYYALSHHMPHHRRMWLLLSNAGRTSSKFASYEGFKRYWKGKLKQLRSGKAKGSAPLVFVPVGFKSEKSGGKTEIDGAWTLQVFVRGRREDGPIWSFPMHGSFAKGPDNMWYLDDGTLAEREAKRSQESL